MFSAAAALVCASRCGRRIRLRTVSPALRSSPLLLTFCEVMFPAAVSLCSMFCIVAAAMLSPFSILRASFRGLSMS